MSDAGYYPQIPAAPADWSRIWAERVSSAVKLLIGKANCTMDFTLTHGATSTTLTNFNIHPGCTIQFMPTTANAATAKPNIYVDGIGKGVAVVHHASSAHTDQTYRVSIVG